MIVAHNVEHVCEKWTAQEKQRMRETEKSEAEREHFKRRKALQESAAKCCKIRNIFIRNKKKICLQGCAQLVMLLQLPFLI